MKINDLGELTGDLLLFGGVYSNLHALEALISVAKASGITPQNAICTGDIVAYCADAAASVRRIRDWGCPVLKGNCEAQLAEGAEDCGCGYDDGSQCSLLSRAWYAHALNTVPEADKDWMASLPDRIVFQHQGLRYAVVHGGASDISRFLWPTSLLSDFRIELEQLKREVGTVDRVFGGHSGIVEVDGVQWINAGAIGMPANDGLQETHYVKLHGKMINSKLLRYEVHVQHQEMQRAGLVQGYDKALMSGYWPSEDTLPLAMRLGRTA
jgi:hypothetical protein